jgi:tRNA A58 N-methylase Trm61
MVRSYIRVYGPPLLKAIRALEAIAVEMSNACIPYPSRMQSDTRDWNQYLNNMKKMYVDCYEPVKIISNASEMLGDFDFFFEWTGTPTMEQIENLIEKIDNALVELGCYYSVTTE